MNAILWIQIGLATLDALILVLLYFFLRTYAPLDRRSLIAMLAGLVGFIFHAFLFFTGFFLVLQLSTCAGIALIYLFMSRRSPDKDNPR